MPLGSRLIGDRQFAKQSFSAAEIIKSDAVRRTLLSGEKILWSSNVDGGRAVEDAMPVAFMGIVFALFPVFMAFAISGRARRPPILLVLFTLPFLCAGLYMVTSPYWSRLNAIQTVCMLTDRRALKIVNGNVACSRFYSSSGFVAPDLVKYDREKDRSNLNFYESYSTHSRVKEGFTGINNGERAFEILKDKLDEADLNK